MNTIDMGFGRVAACVTAVRPGDVDFNIGSMLEMASKAAARGVELCVMPELCVTGYTCADLFGQDALLEAAVAGLKRFASATSGLPGAYCVGLPLRWRGALYNVAAVVSGGTVHGLVPKSYLPTSGEFYERRWFVPGLGLTGAEVETDGGRVPFGTDLLFSTGRFCFGVEICEDLWVPLPPSTLMAAAGAEVVANLSASDELAAKHDYLRSLVSQQSARLHSGYVYSGAGYGESTTDLVFAGNAIVAENGVTLAEAERFALHQRMAVADVDLTLLRHERACSTGFGDTARALGHRQWRRICIGGGQCPSTPWERPIARLPFVPQEPDTLGTRCAEIADIQSEGLMRRLDATRCSNVVIGVSGGLDSTLALLTAVRAFDRLGLDRAGIHAVTMPGFGTTSRTHTNAEILMRRLRVDSREINITAETRLHFKDIDHDETIHDITYENAQARIRTLLLMDIANQTGGMVVGTGDLSELALGWCTYNGDHMSMYGVNASVPKTLVRHLTEWYAARAAADGDSELAAALRDVIATPVSPELLPAAADGTIAQKTEDTVGPYELHDFFLYHTLRHGHRPARIHAMACQAFHGQFTPRVIGQWLVTFYRRFFSQQFKRSCMPDGPKVGSVCLSPRGDWRMPSDASASIWIAEAEAAATTLRD